MNLWTSRRVNAQQGDWQYSGPFSKPYKYLVLNRLTKNELNGHKKASHSRVFNYIYGNRFHQHSGTPIGKWKLEEMRQLTEAGKKALNYIMMLPCQLMRVAERIHPQPSTYQFSWIYP